MDPKMDSGYLKPGETMQDEYDFGQALLPEEIIGIIDQLLCHEVRDSVWKFGGFLADLTDGVAYGSSARPDHLHQLVY